MTTKSNKPVTRAMGVTGLRIWSGILAEEYLTAWSGTRKNKIIIEMQDDPVIATLLSALTMPLVASEFTTAPADLNNARDVEAAEFLQQCMNDMTQYSWRQHVLDMLTMMAWGWSASEIIMKKRLGPDANPPSQYTDGRLGFDILDPRGQETLERWIMSEERRGDVAALVQRDPSTGNMFTIEEWKLVHATYRSRKRSPEGRSPLRELYKPWYMRKNIEIIEMIGAERDLAGLPVIKLPSGATDDDKVAAELIVRNARQDEEGGIVLPAPPPGSEHGWEFELIASKGSKQFRVREIVRDLNKVILMRFFAQFLILGMDKVGTQALVEGSQSFFMLALESIQEELKETWQQQLIPFLFRLNPFPGISGLPTIEWGKPGKSDLAASVQMLKELVGVNVITAGPEIEDYIRAAAGLPDRPEGVGEESRTPPAAPGPGAFPFTYNWAVGADGELIGTPKKASSRQTDVALQYSQPDVSDVHIPSAGKKRRKEAEQEHTGFMFAIPIPVEVANNIALPGGEPPQILHITLTYHPNVEGGAAIGDVISAVAGVVSRAKPFEIALASGTVFEENEERPYVVNVKSDGLLAFRSKLADALERAGFEYSKDYDYIPHVTLKYLGKDGEVPDPQKPTTFICFGMALYTADDKRYGLQFGKQYAQVSGTTGRRERGKIEKATNEYQGKLVRLYDRWAVDARRAIVKAEKAGKHGPELEAVVDEQMAMFADMMKELGRQGILQAVQMGLGDVQADADAFRIVADKVEENEKFIDESLVPDIRAKIVAHLNEVTKTFQLDELALGGILTAMRTRAGGYSGAFWSATFLGAGLGRKKDDKKRRDEGEVPRRVRWVLDPAADHCLDSAGFFGCESLEGEYESWDALPTIPAGQVTCRGNCRCGIEVEEAPGQWVRVA